MKVSLNWLKDYIDVELPADELITGLISIGFDLEGVENQADKLKNFVIGKVLERVKHPNADKLSVCKVDAGQDHILNIVCGAPNVDAGQTVCVALIGAIIPNGEFEIKKSKIRGEFSEGMICSAKEMNMGEDHSGIMVLEDRLPIGAPFAKYLGQNDVVIEIGVTPNRGDLLSHFGVAREIGFLVDKKLKIPAVNEPKGDSPVKDFISVKIDNPDGCYRYCGRMVKNITIKESPEWMQKRLIAVGMRPINNVVDVTNYVMLECGQPLHAFDYDVIEGKQIIVRNSGDTKKFTTLDSKERELNENILLICDAKKPVALAGIMGGENSEIKQDTKNVFIESAFFDPIQTRKSSKYLGLQTDSSYRFERGVDINITEWAANRAAELMAELCDGEIVEGLIDEYPNKLTKPVVSLEIEYLNKISGVEFTSETVSQLLEKIGITALNKSDKAVEFEVPFYRIHDLLRDVDLIEEAVRLYGYENIPLNEFDRIFLDTKVYANEKYDFANSLRAFLGGRGFKEICTNPLVNEKYVQMFTEDYITLQNPSSVDMTVVRPNLYIGALEVVKNNFNFKNNSLKLFEIGDVVKYGTKKDSYIHGIDETKSLLLITAGDYDELAVNEKGRSFEIFDIRGEVQALLEKLNIDNYKLNYYNYNNFFDYGVEYTIGKQILARVFKFSKKCLDAFDIEKPVFGCDLPVNELFNTGKKQTAFKEISKYPPVLRDLSITVDNSVKAADIEKEINTGADKLLKSIRLYDIYKAGEGDQNRTSYTFSLEFSSNEKTLTDEEINQLQDKIIKNLNKKLNAELRSK
ncbi:MAG: phenylalanine--tRNA ligase subunit beta [Ignavibacteriae bacterium]|nr:MAG: phenylalanine--tRNA ligase subunit beta [Ignavibacteriota bacterium]